MFETLFSGDGSRRRRLRRTLTLFLSLTVHAAAIAATIVVPLLHAEAQLPGFAIINAALKAPPAIPVVPPGRRPGKPGNDPATPENGPANPPPRGPREFKVPTEIQMISDEDISDLAPDGPVGPGVPGSPGEEEEGESIFGKDIVPEEIKPMENPTWVIRPPRLIKRVNPAYPSAPLAARIAGAVVIAAVTDIYGRVRQARVVSGHPLLSGAALEAVREWLYEPYLVNGIPKPVNFTVTVVFSLETR